MFGSSYLQCSESRVFCGCWHRWWFNLRAFVGMKEIGQLIVKWKMITGMSRSLQGMTPRVTQLVFCQWLQWLTFELAPADWLWIFEHNWDGYVDNDKTLQQPWCHLSLSQCHIWCFTYPQACDIEDGEEISQLKIIILNSYNIDRWRLPMTNRSDFTTGLRNNFFLDVTGETTRSQDMQLF